VKKIYYPLLACFLISIWTQISCTKRTDELSFPVEPVITLDSISQDTLIEFQDRLILHLSYQDGDGDLGTSNPDINSIFIKDSRLENADEYYLPPLAPETATISIQGTFDVELSPTFLLGNGTEENTIFSLFLKDRAGNESNTVETSEILIVR
jgi:hypothetical protein